MTIDIAAIERQVAELERKNASAYTRTTLFNLVVVVDERDQVRVDKTLSRLLGRRAARIVQIVDTDDAETSVAVSARCMRADNNQSVCFQEIILRNGEDDVAGAPGTWTPLLIRDLPTYVLWAKPVVGIDPGAPVFTVALESADKFLFDSALVSLSGLPDRAEETPAPAPKPARVLGAVTELILAAAPGDTAVSDFAWRRLAPVQGLIAKAFDGVGRENLESYFAAVETVEVRGFSPVEATLLFGWLVSRLENRGFCRIYTPGPDGTTGNEPDLTSAGIEVEISFREEALAGRDANPIRVGVKNDGCADVEGPGNPPRRQAASIPTDGDILLSEVDTEGRDYLYREAIKALA